MGRDLFPSGRVGPVSADLPPFEGFVGLDLTLFEVFLTGKVVIMELDQVLHQSLLSSFMTWSYVDFSQTK